MTACFLCPRHRPAGEYDDEQLRCGQCMAPTCWQCASVFTDRRGTEPVMIVRCWRCR